MVKIETMSFNNVSFHYDDSPELILKNINLDIKTGESSFCWKKWKSTCKSDT